MPPRFIFIRHLPDLGFAPHGVKCAFYFLPGFPGRFDLPILHMGSLCPPLGYAYYIKEVCLIMGPFEIAMIAIGAVVGIAIGFAIGVAYRKKVAEREIGSAEQEATRLINEAIRRFMEMDKLTAPLLRELIDHITV